MAKRKQEAALYIEIQTQEEWEDLLSKEGVTMVDVYADWCGPCKSLGTILRRVKNELGDDLLRYASAKSDTIDALESYRNKSEPCFLFFAGGGLVAVIRGANCPAVIRTIHEQLAAEHKVLDGSAERKQIYDPVVGKPPTVAIPSTTSQQSKVMYKTEEKPKEVTLAIIKPDAVREGKVDEILQQLNESGIEVVHQDVRSLTDDEAKEFYSHLSEEPYFEDYIKFMTSGPSHVLLLTQGETGENVIKNFRDLLGPPSVETAKDEAPQSLRAQYGSSDFMNALHGSDSPDTAAREMAFFFPDIAAPTHTVKIPVGDDAPKKPKLQRTLALIRPKALQTYRDDISSKIEEAGFKVALHKEIQLTTDQAQEFYKEHKDQEYFDDLIEEMTCGPLLALGLAREDAVCKWREMLGPKEVIVAKDEAPNSLRSQFSVPDANINQLHGSDSVTMAANELEYFFPMQKTIAAIKPDAIGTKDEIIDKIHQAGFKIAARKETQLTREMAEQLYEDQRDKDYFDDLVDNMTSGETFFMVLTREDAVDGWRKILGPTDPSVAKEEEPDTVRALFGMDVVHNAAHGSRTTENAETAIQQIFGDIDIPLSRAESGVSVRRESLKSVTGSVKSGQSKKVVIEDERSIKEQNMDKEQKSDTKIEERSEVDKDYGKDQEGGQPSEAIKKEVDFESSQKEEDLAKSEVEGTGEISAIATESQQMKVEDQGNEDQQDEINQSAPLSEKTVDLDKDKVEEESPPTDVSATTQAVSEFPDDAATVPEAILSETKQPSVKTSEPAVQASLQSVQKSEVVGESEEPADKRSEPGTQASEQTIKQSAPEVTPSNPDVKPSTLSVKQSDATIKPSDADVKPSDTGDPALPPSEAAGKSSDVSIKPSDHSVKPADSKLAVQSSEPAVQSSEPDVASQEVQENAESADKTPELKEEPSKSQVSVDKVPSADGAGGEKADTVIDKAPSKTENLETGDQS